ncbi:DMT family transporter [Paenibacillus albiflavus]|uniref:DMT family transporter n=1 Tax=Paenibacillus albiflavus TaxID=2545760 RepID=A0A4R4EMC7_9BACL|nr:DMT family transporter [Paenibacillus albiflavus]
MQQVERTAVTTRFPVSILLFIGILAISFSAILVKWSAAPASIIASHRLLVTVIIMSPLLYKFWPEMKKINGASYIKLMWSGLSLGLHFLLWMSSLRYTSVASSTAILTLEPVVVMVGSYFVFRHKTSFSAIMAMLVAILGAMMIGWGDFRFAGDAWIGDVLSFLSMVAVAIHMILGKSLRTHMSAFVYSWWVFLIGGLLLLIYNLIIGYSIFQYDANEWLLFLLLAIIPTLFGHVLFNWLLKYMSATTVSMSVLGEPLGATILAYLLLNETITWIQAGAGLLLLIGVGLFIKQEK